MVYKHAYLNTLLLLHSTFVLSMGKMTLKGEVEGHALNSHGNCIVDHGKSWNCVFEFLWEPCNKWRCIKWEIIIFHDCTHRFVILNRL